MEITCPDSGPTHTGAALEMVAELVQKDLVKESADTKGDWQPLLFIFTDGKPSDIQKYRQMIPVIRGLEFGAIVGCAAGPKADEQFLKELTDHVVKLDTTDAITLSSFFRWVSSSITQGGQSHNTGENITLPFRRHRNLILLFKKLSLQHEKTAYLFFSGHLRIYGRRTYCAGTGRYRQYHQRIKTRTVFTGNRLYFR